MDIIFAQKQENIKSEISQEITSPFYKSYKISISSQIKIYEKIQKNKEISSCEILQEEKAVKISVSQLNRIRKKWNLSGKKGRPRKKKAEPSSEMNEICYIENIGMKLFCDWFISENKQEKILEIISEKIKSHKQNNPEESFRILQSRNETIAKKWIAISILSLLGINKFSELDYKQHYMKSILGYSYGYSSLRQFLDHLERIDVGKSLNVALEEQNPGEYVYIDGHLNAFWSKKKCIKALLR